MPDRAARDGRRAGLAHAEAFKLIRETCPGARARRGGPEGPPRTECRCCWSGLLGPPLGRAALGCALLGRALLGRCALLGRALLGRCPLLGRALLGRCPLLGRALLGRCPLLGRALLR